MPKTKPPSGIIRSKKLTTIKRSFIYSLDLYFILITQDITLEQIIERMYDKYAPFTYEDELQNIERLMHVVDVATDFPAMLVPFDRQKMQNFFLEEIKKRKKRIFR